MTTNVDRVAELDAIIKQFDLNSHPFYQDWRNGTLPKEKLVRYASEYGEFVNTIGLGWETLACQEYVEEEKAHVELWAIFREELGAAKGAKNPQTNVLVGAAQGLFGSKAEAVGALYAFEAQQPETAQSKLAGLQEHYAMSAESQEYFKVHARQHSEYGDLQAMTREMSDNDFARTRTACAVLASAMWSALDGVYYAD